MKILIIEDNAVHIQSAKDQLIGHELIFATSFEEFDKLLGESYIQIHYDECLKNKPFDVVLTDLFLPPSPKGVTGTQEEAVSKFGDMVPYGLVFAMAALRYKIPTAIISDKGHHGSPINWAMDILRTNPGTSTLFGGGVKFAYHPEWAHDGVKHWDTALNCLLSGDTDPF